MVEVDLVPYPFLAVKLLEVTLDCDTLAIKDKIIPQGRAEDAAAHKTHFALLDIITGVDGLTIANAHNDKFKYNKEDNDIIAVADTHQGDAPHFQPIGGFGIF